MPGTVVLDGVTIIYGRYLQITSAIYVMTRLNATALLAVQLYDYKYCCVFTSMMPRVVSLNSGMTGSDMKLKVMKGSIPWETPSL